MTESPHDPSAVEDEKDDGQPVRGKRAFVCPRCHVWAHQEWNVNTGMGPLFEDDDRLPDRMNLWRRAECRHCGKPSVWRGEQMVYPFRRVGVQPHDDMPLDARALYEEAQEVGAVSTRAGAALARATLELLVKRLDTDAPKKISLNDRLERFRDRVPSHLMQLLDVVRDAGNGSVHPDDEPGELVMMVLDGEQGPELLNVFLEASNQLVDEIVTGLEEHRNDRRRLAVSVAGWWVEPYRLLRPSSWGPQIAVDYLR